MPFTRISMQRGKSAAFKEALVEGIYLSLRDVFAVAEDDRFMAINEVEPGNFIYHPTYLGITRTDDLVVIEITCNNTRTLAQKKALYRDLSERLAAKPGIQPDNVLICLVEVAKENWSMGKGLASFV